jgi:hypothetical protein
MGMFEEPLFDAMLRARHDPDPVRAFRYKPFFYETTRVLPAGDAAGAAGGAGRRWRPERLLAALRFPRPRLSPAPALCCPCLCC